MKKVSLFAFSLCCFCISATAQTKEYFKDKKHELRLFYGSVEQEAFYDSFYMPKGLYQMGSQLGKDNIIQNFYKSAYYSGPMKTTGVFGGSYFYNLSKVRFSFGATFSYAGYQGDYLDRINHQKKGKFNGHSIGITPAVRYAWISKSWFRLYSGVGLSIYFDKGKYSVNGPTNKNHGLKENTSGGALQLTPIGFSVGKDWFAFGEANLGGRTGNFIGGIGYRF